MKLPARGAPEREIMGDGDGRRERQVRRACFSYRVATLSVLSRPLPCHTTCGGGGGRGAVAHRLCSEVSSPSCEGTLPLRSVSIIHLQEGRRGGIMGGTATNAEGGKCDARASLTRRHSPCHPTPYSATAWRRGGGRGAVAHRYSSLVSSPSCVGTPPVRSFFSRILREGRRSGIMGERRRTQRAASATRVLHPPPYPPPPRYSAMAWRRGCAELRRLTGSSGR